MHWVPVSAIEPGQMTMQPMGHLLDALDANLADWTSSIGIPAYRCRQIRHWIFERQATDWQKMCQLWGFGSPDPTPILPTTEPLGESY